MQYTPKRSAGLIGWGIVLLVIGMGIYTHGLQRAVEDMLSRWGGDTADGFLVGGAVVAIVGMACLVWGLFNLAQTVDYLGRRKHAERAAELAAETDSA